MMISKTVVSWGCVWGGGDVVGHQLDIPYGKMGNWVGLYRKNNTLHLQTSSSKEEFLRPSLPFSPVAICNFYLFLLIASAHHQLRHSLSMTFTSLSFRSGSPKAQKTGKFHSAHHPSQLPPKLQAHLSQFLLQSTQDT